MTGDMRGREEPELVWRYGLWIVGCGFIVLALLGTVADADLYLWHDISMSRRCPRGGFYKTVAPWIWLNWYGEYPALLLAIGAAVGVVRRVYAIVTWVRYRRACALLVLAVVLGPGLLVNGILKPLWGRPRPHQVEALVVHNPIGPGGNRESTGGGKSFPSGHAAMGYVLVAGSCLVSPRRSSWLRGLVLGGALTYGSLVGMARVGQGAHFVSDVLWSGGLMCFTVATLHAVLPVTSCIGVDTYRALHPPRAIDTLG